MIYDFLRTFLKFLACFKLQSTRREEHLERKLVFREFFGTFLSIFLNFEQKIFAWVVISAFYVFGGAF